MIAAYQRISRADGDLGKDGKDKSNSIENQKELIQRYISCKESLQNVPVMDFVDDGYTGSNFDRPGLPMLEHQRVCYNMGNRPARKRTL